MLFSNQVLNNGEYQVLGYPGLVEVTDPNLFFNERYKDYLLSPLLVYGINKKPTLVKPICDSHHKTLYRTVASRAEEQGLKLLIISRDTLVGAGENTKLSSELFRECIESQGFTQSFEKNFARVSVHEYELK